MLLGQLSGDAYDPFRAKDIHSVIQEFPDAMRGFIINLGGGGFPQLLKMPPASRTFGRKEAMEAETVGRQAGDREGGHQRARTGHGENGETGLAAGANKAEARVAYAGRARIADQAATLPLFDGTNDFGSYGRLVVIMAGEKSPPNPQMLKEST